MRKNNVYHAPFTYHFYYKIHFKNLTVVSVVPGEDYEENGSAKERIYILIIFSCLQWNLRRKDKMGPGCLSSLYS